MRESRIDHSAMPPQESWRDVAAAYLVHTGLRLASGDGRNRMLHALSDEWRARVRRQLDAATRASRHLAAIDGETRETG
jgi:hypothetical protein